MTGRERFLTALDNRKPDYLPCQVHNWMPYYLKTYLNGMSDTEAYEFVGMDPVLYRNPKYIFADKDLANWQVENTNFNEDSDGSSRWIQKITTPKGILTSEGANNKYTGWITKQIIENERDFEIWNEYVPLPVKVDWSPVLDAKKLIGDRGIVRGSFFDFGQGSPWQSFVGYMYDAQQAIFDYMDNPDWIKYVMQTLLDKKMRVIEIAGKFCYDLVETGGGAGSSTVISPDMHRDICLPYDKLQHKAIKEAGSRIVYHLCGGLMPLLETVAQNGADALETMTPKSMGGDCDLAEASKRIGEKLCFIGGFDQNAGFEKGTKEYIESAVDKLFKSKPAGGFIISPSDHFFFGSPENIKYFATCAKNCKY